MTAHIVSAWLNLRAGASKIGYRPGDPLEPTEPAFTLRIDAVDALDAARTGYLIGHGVFRDRPGDPWPAAVRPVRVGDVFHVISPDPDGVVTETWVAVDVFKLRPLTTDPTKGAP